MNKVYTFSIAKCNIPNSEHCTIHQIINNLAINSNLQYNTFCKILSSICMICWVIIYDKSSIINHTIFLFFTLTFLNKQYKFWSQESCDFVQSVYHRTANLHPQQPHMSSPAACGIVGPCFLPVCCEYQRMMHQTYRYCKVFLSVQVSQGDL